MRTKARPFAVVALAVLLGASPAPPGGPAATPAAAAGDAAYAALAKAYFAESFRAAPVAATQVGIHDYDTQLGSSSAAAYAA